MTLPTNEFLTNQAKRIEVTDRAYASKGEFAKIAAMKSITPEQAKTWIDNNVSDLATAKVALGYLAHMIIAMRDHVWPELMDE